MVNDIKFTGATLDNSGTYYLGSRHYDPNTGRFLQQDTFKGDVYSPWTQNLYTYTSNNPVNYVDPTGHLFKELLDSLVNAIAKAAVQVFTGATKEEIEQGIRELGAAKKVAQTERKGKNSRTRGTGFKSKTYAIYAMQLMAQNESDSEKGKYEFGAFVYQGDDGLYYISNTIKGIGRTVGPDLIEKELTNLGLLGANVDKVPEIYFTHTHLYNDERNRAFTIIVGVDKSKVDENKKPTAIEKSINEAKTWAGPYTQHGSIDDWDIINEGSMAGRFKLKSFGIMAPKSSTRWTGEWNEPENKYFD